MKTLKRCTLLAFLATQLTLNSQVTFETTITSTDDYEVNIEVQLLNIVSPQSCANGYNYNVELGYDITFSGNNVPANLWTLQGNVLNCGDASTIFFDLPNQGGFGTLTTTSNPWRSQTDCATASLSTFGCEELEITINGPGISSQTITLGATAPSNGNDQDWCMDGNLSDTTKFLGTTNNSPLIIRTNNEERMRITGEGNLGLGISNPQEKLDLLGNARLSGDLIFSSYASPNDTIDRFIVVNKDGQTQSKTLFQLKNLIYADPYIELLSACDLAGHPIQQNPSWTSAPYKLYVRCPDIFVGLGTDSPQQQLHVTHRAVFGHRIGIGNTDPQARLHIRTHLTSPTEKLFLIERQTGNNDPHTIFQITNDGLARSREVKVDQDAWPDYVFTKDYNLMPLSELKLFISNNGHLPNVPAAKEIESEGLELGATAKITMEKVEELTLYTIEQQEQLDEQKEVIEAQQKMLEEQRELIEAQKRALEELMLIIGK